MRFSWELALAPTGLSAERPRSLEPVCARIRSNCAGVFLSAAKTDSGIGNEAAGDDCNTVFFRVPLDTARLAEFRSHDPAHAANNGNGSAAGGDPGLKPGDSWQAFYSQQNEDADFEWHLRLRDLTRNRSGSVGKFWKAPAFRWRRENSGDRSVQVSGRTGSPSQAFNRPRISRTTENVSCVLRHQWIRIERILGRGAHDQLANLSPRQFPPQRFHAARVLRRCDDHHARDFLAPHLGRNFFDLLLVFDDRLRKNA